MNLPTVKSVEALHRKYAPSDSAFESVWEHVNIIWSIAEELIANQPSLKLNPQLVKVGCLVHDIGVYKLYDKKGNIDTKNYITHGILGYEILQSEGYPDYLCSFPRNHIGVGVTKKDIKTQKLPLPLANYTPKTLEEKIVTFADKFHSKSDPPIFNSVSFYKKFLSDKFGEHKVKIFESMLKEFGEPDLKTIMKRFNYSPDRIRQSP